MEKKINLATKRQLELEKAFRNARDKEKKFKFIADRFFHYFKMGAKWERERPKEKDFLEYGQQFHEAFLTGRTKCIISSNQTIQDMEQTKQELLVETLIKRKALLERTIAKLATVSNDSVELIIAGERITLFDIPGCQTTIISLLNIRLSEIKKEIYNELYPDAQEAR